MREIYSDIIQFRGTHYEFGRFQGNKIKNTLTIKNRKNQWKVRIPRFSIEEKETRNVIKQFAPGIWEEILGLQDSLEWPIESILQEFGGYRLDYVHSGCSVMTGRNYLIRNYDYHPKTYEGRYTLFQPSDNGYAIIGPSQRVTGRMDGMNEKGLAIGYNFMNRKRPKDGFICCMIARLVLEVCANVEEAADMLQEIPHRHSFSYIVFDRTGKTLVIEASPRGTEIREATICTNHFEMMKKENRHHLKDSLRRSSILENNQSANLTAEEAFQLLNDKEKGIFSEDYGSWAGTIHTSAYFPTEMKSWFVLGSSRTPVELDFDNWLKGNDLSFPRIKGEINTSIPFVHMDEDADWFQRKK